ncbi:MAG: hypothetical protein HC777_01320 [Hyphomonadaceae bacterium]|nr:hypothetical protein [Hyphomonadaceae bacterium]
MKFQVQTVAAIAYFMSVGLVTAAQAEVRDRIVVVNGSPAAQYAQVVEAASAMCREASEQGEVFNVRRCVKVVVAATIAEMDRPDLRQYAQAL